MNSLVGEFHDLYWKSGPWKWTFWQGVPVLKCPLDLWIYQELLWLVRPELVVELGTWAGGTAVFIADVMNLYGADIDCGVLTVDILDASALRPHVEPYEAAAPFATRIRPPHPRVQYVVGDSVSDTVVEYVHAMAAGKEPTIVIADSDHSFEHSSTELQRYHDLVTPQSWFVMEDTDGPGPRAAVADFLGQHKEFSADLQCEKFLMTFNPGGYLRRL